MRGRTTITSTSGRAAPALRTSGGTRPALLAAVMMLAASTAAAQPAPAPASPAPAPTPFDAVMACQAITDPAGRLACFDRAVPALDQARRDRQIVVMDREEVRQTRRGLFGLQLPAVRIFGGGDDDDENDVESVDSIESTITRSSQDGYGKWTFVLADGARWQQIDARRIAIAPRPGMTIAIRRAAMGSFLANIGGQTAIRVRRIN